jgi:organic radical activating enzyme
VSYLVNEIYLTLHGEGVRYGIPHVFVRLAQCNLTCGFCDTEFTSFVKMEAAEIVAAAKKLADDAYRPVDDTEVPGQRADFKAIANGPVRNVLFCGGEPLLQVDAALTKAFKDGGWYTVVETNGTLSAPAGLDWITCSPKVAEHAIRLEFAHELKYVRAKGQGIPRPKLASACHFLISPMFTADGLDRENLEWCVNLVKANPAWRLTIQHHKLGFGGMR